MSSVMGWLREGTMQLDFGRLTAEIFSKGDCRVLISREKRPTGAFVLPAHLDKWRYHLSISCADRYPTWEEIKDARYSLLPHGLTFAQILPPPKDWVNIHPNCFHLWEIEEGEW